MAPRTYELEELKERLEALPEEDLQPEVRTLARGAERARRRLRSTVNLYLGLVDVRETESFYRPSGTAIAQLIEVLAEDLEDQAAIYLETKTESEAARGIAVELRVQRTHERVL